jgi:thiol-disulfide isomerase/thioredoxin
VFPGYEATPDRTVSGLLASGAVHVYPLTAVRADFRKQDFSTFARQFYVDATFPCRRCGKEFPFSADEQKYWYEECKFYVDSVPRECPSCRRALRDLKALKQEYDRDVGLADQRNVAMERKERLVEVVDALVAGGVVQSPRMAVIRITLVKQIERLRQSGAA